MVRRLALAGPAELQLSADVAAWIVPSFYGGGPRPAKRFRISGHVACQGARFPLAYDGRAVTL
jgi:hypothetical protein